MTTGHTKYFRRDQKAGVTPPDLARGCTYAEHIVRARGKKSRFTSVSLDPAKIDDFGEVLYELKRPATDNAGHKVVEHGVLMKELQDVAKNGAKEARLRALQAVRYAGRRAEALVDWALDHSKVPQKDRFKWAAGKIAPYFAKKS